MEIITLIATLILLIAMALLGKAVYNIRVKNYSGGRQTDSLSRIIAAGAGLIIVAWACLFTGHQTIAAVLVGIPAALILLYACFWLVLPLLFRGNRKS